MVGDEVPMQASQTPEPRILCSLRYQEKSMCWNAIEIEIEHEIIIYLKSWCLSKSRFS